MFSHPSGPTRQPVLLRAGDSLLTWAVLKLKDLELLSLQEATGSMLAWGKQGKPAPRRVDWPQEELMDPAATAPGQGGQRQVKGTRELAAAAAQSQEAGAGGVDRRAE
eukprot:1161700-Pelagomonas_calceolata.AAC.11